MEYAPILRSKSSIGVMGVEARLLILLFRIDPPLSLSPLLNDEGLLLEGNRVLFTL